MGVGKALYSKLMDYAHEHNYGRVAWEVLDWNQNAIDFYENSGANLLRSMASGTYDQRKLEKIYSEVSEDI